MKIELDHVEFISETHITIRGSRRRTTVPKEIVDRLNLEDGERLRWVLLNDGTIFIVRVKPAA